MFKFLLLAVIGTIAFDYAHAGPVYDMIAEVIENIENDPNLSQMANAAIEELKKPEYADAIEAAMNDPELIESIAAAFGN